MPSLFTGLKGTLSDGLSELPGSNVPFLGTGGDVGFVAFFEFFNEGSLSREGGEGEGVLGRGVIGTIKQRKLNRKCQLKCIVAKPPFTINKQTPSSWNKLTEGKL